MITTAYNFDSGSGFIYDMSKIGFVADMAQLIPVDNPGLTFIPSIADSSFDSSILVYDSGALKQIDKRPANATFYAALTTSLAGNWGEGSLTISPVNGAAISGGLLDLTGATNKYATFSAVGNADSALAGSIEFKYKPNYSGAPSTVQILFSVGQSVSSFANAIVLTHYTDGKLYLQIFDSTATQVVIIDSSFNPTAETTYTILCQYDGESGVSSVYVDGVLLVTTDSPQTFSTRTNSIYGFIGNQNSGGGNANFFISNLSFYSAVVTPSSPVLPDTAYEADTGELPNFSYSGLGSLQRFSGFSATGSNIAFIMNGLYWNGSAWVSSSGAYAQANSAAVVAANIASLPASNTLDIDVVYPAQNMQGQLSALTVTYVGQIYSISNPSIYPNQPLPMDALSAFIDVISASGSDGVRWLFKIGSSYYYFNGSSWTISNQSYAQSNPSAIIQTNLSTLPISAGAFVTPIALLHSADGSSTPMLTSLSVTYDYFGVRPVGPNVCTVYGYIIDERDNPVVGAVVAITNPTTFINQGIVQAQGVVSVTTNSEGYFSVILCETTTLNKLLSFKVTYPISVSQGVGKDIYLFGSTRIPNAPSINLTALVFS